MTESAVLFCARIFRHLWGRHQFLRLVGLTILFSSLWIALYESAHLFDISRSASAWYPGPGLTIAFMAIFGPRCLLCAIIGVFSYDNSFSLLDMMSGLRHITVYGAAGLYLRNTMAFPLRQRSHVNLFVAVACGSTLLSAVWAGLIFGPYWINSTFTDILVSFWVGDLAGVLLACPAFLMLFALLTEPAAATAARHWLPRPIRSQWLGVLSVIGVAAAAFSVDATFHTNGKAWFVVLFPVTMLALRDGFGGAVVGIAVANITTVLLFKAFGGVGDPAQLQVFLVMTDVAALLIGAAISEHKDTGDQLRDSERRQRTIASENRMLAAAVHASPVSVTIIDTKHPHLPLLFANEAFMSLSGYKGDSSRFLNLTDVLATGQVALPASLLSAIHGHKRVTCEVDLITAEGGVLRDRMILAPIMEGDAPSSAYLVLHEDVAASRQRETAEREREKLVALGQLAGGVAHEINNLLHPMINLAMEAEHLWGQEGQDVRRHLRMIRSCGTKAANIVRKVLSFARQGTGPHGPLAFGDAVLAAIDLNRRSLPPSVIIHTRISATGTIRASATEVSQVLTNLLLNASQAMGNRGTINIALDRDDAASASSPFRLTFTDNGAGMDEAVRARIFEPFFTTKPIGSGTGLGLSVVYGIVKDWGGSIDVRTAPNKGTTFIVTVPAADANT